MSIDLEQLDLDVARAVFNFTIEQNMVKTFQGLYPCPKYSSDISKAKEVCEEMNKKSDEVVALFMKNLAIENSLNGNHPTPEEICVSAIKALKGQAN